MEMQKFCDVLRANWRNNGDIVDSGEDTNVDHEIAVMSLDGNQMYELPRSCDVLWVMISLQGIRKRVEIIYFKKRL